LYTPNAIVLHDQRRNLKDFIKRMYLFGYGRGINRLWDLQVIPPIMALVVFLLLPASPMIFLSMILLYLSAIFLFDLKIFLKTRKVQYLVTVPVVFVVEHVSYTLGFWIGLLKSLKGS